MRDPNARISDDDLYELTGVRQPAAQCRRLQEQGIKFITNSDGHPRLTYESLNRQLASQGVAPYSTEVRTVEGPRFESL